MFVQSLRNRTVIYLHLQVEPYLGLAAQGLYNVFCNVVRYSLAIEINLLPDVRYLFLPNHLLNLSVSVLLVNFV